MSTMRKAGLLAAIAAFSCASFGARAETPQAGVATTAVVRRGATFTIVLDAGKTLRRYDFQVWTELAAAAGATDASQYASRSWTGEAVATLRVCVKATRRCSSSEMRAPAGPLAPIGAATGESTFFQEPGLRAAAFKGALVRKASSCAFDVTWVDASSNAAPSGGPEQQVSPDQSGPDGVARDSFRRAANVVADSTCWPHLQARGSVWSSGDGALTTTSA